MNRALTVVGLAAVWLLALRADADAYNGGPLRNVTDLTSHCAVCHSSVGKEQLRVEPEAFATLQIFENKHYKALEEGLGEYQKMSVADRQKLLADVKTMDQNASVTINAPSALKPGQEMQITVTVKGGQGVVGVLLMDTNLRFQGRSLQADGWLVVGAPKVWGSDGHEQTKWLDSRRGGLKKNLSGILIFDQKTDIAAKKLADGKVVWTVKAPPEPGSYTLTAAFLFGTEKASPLGTVTAPTGAILPRGGPGGPSARIMFAKPLTVTVR